MKIFSNNQEYILDVSKAIATGALTPLVVHKIGNRYRRRFNGEEFILASVDVKKINLISLKDGLRHADCAVELQCSTQYDNLPNSIWNEVTNNETFDLIS